MRTPPADLTTHRIVAALADRWGLTATAMEYVPLGFGSHHWAATLDDGTKRFVTADQLPVAHLADDDETRSFALLRAAFTTAAQLRADAGLAFVVAPQPDRTAEPVVRVGGRYALAVYPFLDVAPTEFGTFRNMDDREEALGLVGMVHRATPVVPRGALRRHTLAIPREPELRAALDALDEPWTTGPYAEPVRRLLRDTIPVIHDRMDRLAAMRRRVEADRSGWVVTHGEPHAGNVVRTRADDLVMVDWDTAALAPRERDLWHLVNDDTPDWQAYRDVTGVTSLSRLTLDACRLHWDLSDIASYVAWFRAPHERTGEMELAWEALQASLTDGGLR